MAPSTGTMPPMDVQDMKKKEEEVPRPALKEQSGMKHGSYSAAVKPLMMLTLCLSCGLYTTNNISPDSRTVDWLLVDNFWTISIICVLYILFATVWGPKMMEGRTPYQLKTFMLAYNALQVFGSFYMFVESGLSGWFFDYNLRCEPCNTSTEGKPMRMALVAHWFFLSKILDFVDTAVFVLRGKPNQITYLHVIHHSCMVASMWYGIRFEPGGHNTFLVVLNSFIHMVMYSYYLLAAMGPKVQPYLWWKKYLTRIQLTQFIVIFLHAFQLLFFPCKGVTMGIVAWTLLYSLIFFSMFLNFYIKAYLFGNKNKNKKTTSVPVASEPTHLPAMSNGSIHNSSSAEPSTIGDFMASRATHRMPNTSSIVL